MSLQNTVGTYISHPLLTLKVKIFFGLKKYYKKIFFIIIFKHVSTQLKILKYNYILILELCYKNTGHQQKQSTTKKKKFQFITIDTQMNKKDNTKNIEARYDRNILSGELKNKICSYLHKELLL